MAVASAIASERPLIVFDEPTSGLDPVSRDELTELLRRIAVDGQRSVLFSTHITSDLEKCASHITFIKDGTIHTPARCGLPAATTTTSASRDRS